MISDELREAFKQLEPDNLDVVDNFGSKPDEQEELKKYMIDLIGTKFTHGQPWIYWEAVQKTNDSWDESDPENPIRVPGEVVECHCITFLYNGGERVRPAVATGLNIVEAYALAIQSTKNEPVDGK